MPANKQKMERAESAPTPSATTPERYVFRFVMEQCLRHFSGYLMEAGKIEELRRLFGDHKVVRGEEGSLIDVALDLLASGDLTGVEVKSLSMSYRHQTEIGKTQGPRWIGDISHQPGQLKSDFWLICFPLSRDAHWSAILSPKTPGLAPVSTDRSRICFRYADLGQRIHHVIPAPLWPYAVSLADARGKEDTPFLKRDQGQPPVVGQDEDVETETETEGEDDSPEDELDGQSKRLMVSAGKVTHGDLKNNGRDREQLFMRYLGDWIGAAPSSAYRASGTVLVPYTADLAVRHQDGGVVLLEAKLGYCEVTGKRHPRDSRLIQVRHLIGHPNNGAPIFTYTSGRWTYLLTTYGRETFLYKGQHIPRYALLIHRDDIPRHWWYNRDGIWLFGYVDEDCIVDLRATFASHAQSRFDADRAQSRFDLPALESFDGVTQEQLSHGLEKAASNPFCFETRAYKAREDTRMAYRHQAQFSLHLLHACHSIRQGLIFDWQMNELNLRSYAFTPHVWSPRDTAYTSSRPCRPPKEIFQLPDRQRFVLLSFGQARQHAENDQLLVNSTTLCGVKIDHQLRNFPSGRRILVITSPRGDLNFLDTPLYAVPDGAIDCGGSTKDNYQGKPVNMLAGEDIEDYYVESGRAFLQHMAQFLEVSEDTVLGERGIRAHWRRNVHATSRSEIYEAILSRNEEKTDKRDAKKNDSMDEAGGEKDREQDFTTF